MKPRLALFAGWGYAPDALAPLARLLAARFAVSLHAADEAAAQLAAGDPPAVAVGWSYGGMRLLAALAGGAPAPARLVLVNTTARFTSAPDCPHGVPLAEVRAMMAGLRKDSLATLGAFHRRAGRPATGPDSGLAAAALARYPAANLLAGLEFMKTFDLRDKLGLVPPPAAVIHAQEDHIIPCPAGQWLAEATRAGRWVGMEQAGHDAPVRTPERLARIILEGEE